MSLAALVLSIFSQLYPLPDGFEFKVNKYENEKVKSSSIFRLDNSSKNAECELLTEGVTIIIPDYKTDGKADAMIMIDRNNEKVNEYLRTGKGNEDRFKTADAFISGLYEDYSKNSKRYA